MMPHKPNNKFLQDVYRFLIESGYPVDSRQFHGRETIRVDWIPENKRGLPVFIDQFQYWENSASCDDDYCLSMQIDDRQNLKIYCPINFGNTYIHTLLLGCSEIVEIKNFFESTNADDIGKSGWIESPLNLLLDSVFLLVCVDNKSKLIRFAPDWLLANRPKLCDPLEFELGGDAEWVNSNEYYGFSRWMKDHGLLEGIPLFDISDADLLVENSGNLRPIRSFEYQGNSERDQQFGIVFRVKNNVSKIYLTEYFSSAIECEGFLSDIIRKWKTLPREIAKYCVKLPSTLRDQTATALEIRFSRQSYLEEVENLAKMREPVRFIAERYKKRTQSVKLLHSITLEEINSIRNPLPFFIEYPYRRYVRADDGIQKLKTGQILLNILAKIPLFFVLEEILQDDSSLSVVNSLLDRLRANPLSDGSFLGLRRELAASLSKDFVSSRLKVFSGIYQNLIPDNGLDELVAARNRYHHPPFTESHFLEVLARNMPPLIDSLRNSLQHVKVIIPKSFKFKDGKRLISAVSVSGYDSDFSTTEFETTSSFESFPVDSLVALSTSHSKTVILSNWITHRRVTAESLDFGVFDRMKRGEPEFSFVRSL
jgi:hypothetical protein